MKSSKSVKIGLVGSKTSSVDQILLKNFRGHIFSLILMKFIQNICLNKMLDKLENGSCWVKN